MLISSVVITVGGMALMGAKAFTVAMVLVGVLLVLLIIFSFCVRLFGLKRAARGLGFTCLALACAGIGITAIEHLRWLEHRKTYLPAREALLRDVLAAYEAQDPGAAHLKANPVRVLRDGTLLAPYTLTWDGTQGLRFVNDLWAGPVGVRMRAVAERPGPARWKVDPYGTAHTCILSWAQLQVHPRNPPLLFNNEHGFGVSMVHYNSGGFRENPWALDKDTLQSIALIGNRAEMHNSYFSIPGDARRNNHVAMQTCRRIYDGSHEEVRRPR